MNSDVLIPAVGVFVGLFSCWVYRDSRRQTALRGDDLLIYGVLIGYAVSRLADVVKALGA